jgi:hypothetical protein
MELNDFRYLLLALRNGGVNVKCPEIRRSLMKVGYLTPAKIKDRYSSGYFAHGMALTKEGQRRAIEIKKQLDLDRIKLTHSKERRGIRGAAFPRIISKGNKNV